MNPANLLAALEILIRLGTTVTHLASVARNAQAEGRDLTDAELDQFKSLDDAARQTESDAIARAQAEGR